MINYIDVTLSISVNIYSVLNILVCKCKRLKDGQKNGVAEHELENNVKMYASKMIAYL